VRSDLGSRTREFALQIVRLYVSLPKTPVAQILGKQLLRSGTSVGAHYCEGHRSRSDAELVSKMEGALQELEEAKYWLDLLAESQSVAGECADQIAREADELIAIFVTCVKKVKDRKTRSARSSARGQ
jgi:four helix bundle protein